MIGRITRHQALRQLVKFCIVGASSTVLDNGVLWILLTSFAAVPWWLSKTLSFCLGVTNGFIWNRLWTFKGRQQRSIAKQYPVFVATNAIGLALNLLIAKGVLVLLTGQVTHAINPQPRDTMLASLSAIPFVMIWNFSAAKFFTFRGTEPSTPPLAEPH